MVKPDFKVSASDMRRRWQAMNERAGLDFASNFHETKDWSDNDTEILEVIMHDGSDSVCSCLCAYHAETSP